MARLKGAQRMILQAISDLPKDAGGYVTDAQIAHHTRITLDDLRDLIETLEGDEYVEVARREADLSVSITAEGRLAPRQYLPFSSTAPGPSTSSPSTSAQTTAFYWRQDWGGGSRQLGQIPEPVGVRAREVEPMPNIDDEVRAVLRPLMGDQNSRRARLARAFAKYPGLLDRINVDGETGVFLSHLINTLRDYGDLEPGLPAIHVLLESIKSEVGAGDRQRIDSIVRRPGNESNPDHPQLDPIKPPKSTRVTTMSQNTHAPITPTVGIITALPHEFNAVRAMLIDPDSDYDSATSIDYCLGAVNSKRGGVHQIALAMSGMGNNLAALYAEKLLARYPTVHSVLMVGIAGGAPSPGKPVDHVRLGDIVVSDQYGSIQYDMLKQEIDDIQFRNPPRAPGFRWITAASQLQAGKGRGERPWEDYIKEGLSSLGWIRPPASSDVLMDTGNPPNKIPHPKDPERRADYPRVFQAPIASANILLKDPTKRDAIRDRFKVKAFEMEASGVADASWTRSQDYFVVRGICDYCDDNKNDLWQPYAAMAAAAYVRALLESIPGTISANPP